MSVCDPSQSVKLKLTTQIHAASQTRLGKLHLGDKSFLWAFGIVHNIRTVGTDGFGLSQWSAFHWNFTQKYLLTTPEFLGYDGPSPQLFPKGYLFSFWSWTKLIVPIFPIIHFLTISPSEATASGQDFCFPFCPPRYTMRQTHILMQCPGMWHCTVSHIWNTYIPELHSHPWNTFSILLWHLELNITSHTDVIVSSCVWLTVYSRPIFLFFKIIHSYYKYVIFLIKEEWMQVCIWIHETYAREFEISDIIGILCLKKRGA